MDRASASGSVNLGFDSKSGQTNDLKIGIHSFPAGCQHQGDSVEQAGKFAYCAHGVGRVVGALSSEAGFAGSMLN